ncbi:MAG: IS1182 family transposase [Thermodesulfobacteriota bacterium]|nr:IS1182 family transposase [Thermodesulfobacteriota bacterium]
MSKTYRPWNPNQQYLLPPSVQDWLPENDLVYFILDTVNELDISAIIQKYEQEKRGFPPFHPRMMVALLLYSYCRGIFSSRKIMQACQERISFKVIVGDDMPNFRTISDFRKLHLKELQLLFVQVLQLCQEAGLVKLGHIALDGTKIKANASRHKAMSYGRILKEEKRLTEEIKQLLEKAEAIDQQEDDEYGPDRRGDELPEELARRGSRLKRIQKAKRALEAKAKATAQEIEKQREKEDSTNDDKPKRGRKRKIVSEVPADNKQYNFTDPESSIMKANNKGWDQCGNAQAAVDNKKQIIVACDVTNESNDKQQFEPMLEQAQENVGEDKKIKSASADSGYYSESNVKFAEDKKIDAYIATKRTKHSDLVTKVPRGRLPKDLTVQEKMARKLRTKKGCETYSKRKSIVEPVFGQIKRARGFVQFSLRGIEKMRGEWAIVCLTHNLLKLFRAQYAIAA